MQVSDVVARAICDYHRDDPLDREVVQWLGQSMARIGLLNPITLWRGPGGLQPILLAGRHRLAAAIELGWDTIPAYFIDHGNERTAIDSEIASIDENLIRRDLGRAERARLTSRRKELYEAEHPETARPGPRRNRSKLENNSAPAERFTRRAARVTGRSEASVARDAQRGEAIGKYAEKIAGTSLDKGVELDALVSMPEIRRVELMERAAQGEQVSAVRELKKAKRPRAEPIVPSRRVRKVVKMWTEYIQPQWDKATEAERAMIRALLNERMR